jgi:hypothetical protein
MRLYSNCKSRNGIFLTVLILSLALLLPACQAFEEAVNDRLKGGIQTGVWSEDGKTFINEWSNILVTLPEGFRALSPEELQSVVGAGEDIIVNDGTLKQSDIDVSKLMSAYDFMVVTEEGLPNAMLMYDNIGLQTQVKDEAGYFSNVTTQMEAIEQMGYASVGTSTKTLADEDWFVGTMSVADGMMYQDYYLKKADKIIIGFIVTYTDETKDIADTLVAAVGKAK